VGMGLSELEKLNEKPFLLYPDSGSRAWTSAWWSKEIVDGPLGKLAERLGEDVELQWEMRVDPENADWGYIASDKKPSPGLTFPSVICLYTYSQSTRGSASSIGPSVDVFIRPLRRKKRSFCARTSAPIRSTGKFHRARKEWVYIPQFL